MDWSPADWRSMPTLQQPPWPDPEQLDAAVASLRAAPALTTAAEIRGLSDALSEVALGRALVLQAGDCAESFLGSSGGRLDALVELLQQMAGVLAESSSTTVVQLARIAGQFAKPRTSMTEMVDAIVMPSFQGHIVNDEPPIPYLRRPDPGRMLLAYHVSALALRGLRERARARQTTVWTAHESLLMPYEEGSSRLDEETGRWFDCSAHFLWVGERTRQPGGGQVRFLSGIANPVGCKLGPGATPEDVLRLCEVLDPERTPGRLTLIARMGAEQLARRLPPIVEQVRRAGFPVIWVCDPMHANMDRAASGIRTRRLTAILREVETFHQVHRAEATWAGGLHLEVTPEDVTECVGGDVSEDQVHERFWTLMDPRLNAGQALSVTRRAAALGRLPQPSQEAAGAD
jgi:3-deoxy-7-phosphoheptulonate synthase